MIGYTSGHETISLYLSLSSNPNNFNNNHHLYLQPSTYLSICFIFLLYICFLLIRYTTRHDTIDTRDDTYSHRHRHCMTAQVRRAAGILRINTTIPTTTTTKTTTPPNTHLIVHVVRVESVLCFVCLRYTCLLDRCSSVSWRGFESYLVPGE